MEKIEDLEFSGGDASYFISVLQEWHTTEGIEDKITVSKAVGRMSGAAKTWADLLPLCLYDSAESFFQAMNKKWPPKSAISCQQTHYGLKQKPEQTVQAFINEISYRSMQHILKDCHCCEVYLAIDDVYDKLTAMVYDILVRGANSELKPFLSMALNGSQRFSSSKKLLRIAANNAEVMLKSRSKKSGSNDGGEARLPAVTYEDEMRPNRFRQSVRMSRNKRSMRVPSFVALSGGGDDSESAGVVLSAANLESILEPELSQLRVGANVMANNNPVLARILDEDLKSTKSASTTCSAAAPAPLAKVSTSSLSSSASSSKSCTTYEHPREDATSTSTVADSQPTFNHRESLAYIQNWQDLGDFKTAKESKSVSEAELKKTVTTESRSYWGCLGLATVLALFLILLAVLGFFGYRIALAIWEEQHEACRGMPECVLEFFVEKTSQIASNPVVEY